jgi:hypothetical protein
MHLDGHLSHKREWCILALKYFRMLVVGGLWNKLMILKNAVFWGVNPCGSCRNRCFGGTQRLHHLPEMSVFTRVTRRNITEDSILQANTGSIVVKALGYKPEGRGFDTRLGEWFLPVYLTLPAALDHGVYSASNRNECQKQKNYVRFEVFTAVTMKNGVFWDVTPCGSCENLLTRATRRNILEDAILKNNYVFGE